MSSTPHDPLQRWLDAIRDGAGAEPPPGTEPEVVEAVYALRPDLAPAPRLSIDDILDSIEDGPFAPPLSAEATAFARWLDRRDADTADLDDDLDEEDDLDLDGDALEAVYALRPDLAPAPRLSIDDILGAVAEGPLARPQAQVIPIVPPPRITPPTAETTPDSAGEGAEVVSLASRRQRMWWALPGMGALMAAAAALLVVQPMSLESSSPVDPALDAARYAPQAEAPAVPMAATAPRPAAPAARSREQSSGEEAVLADPVPAPAPPPPPFDEATFAEAGPSAKDASLARRPEPAKEEARAAPTMTTGTTTTTPTPAESLSTLGYLESGGMVAPAGGATSDSSVGRGGMEREAAEPTPTRQHAQSITPPPVTASTSATAGRVASSLADEDQDVFSRDRSDDIIESVELESSGRDWLGRNSSTPRPRRLEESASAPAADMAPAAPEASFAEEEEYAPSSEDLNLDTISEDDAEDESRQTATVVEIAAGRTSNTGGSSGSGTASRADLDALKARASWSLGGIPDVKAADAAWARASAEAAAMVQAGRLGDALGVLGPFQGSAVPDVRMDAAWERAQIYLRQGQVQVALRSVDAGLAATGGDRRLRARLLYQKGLLLERLSDPEGAVRAYQAAAALR